MGKKTSPSVLICETFPLTTTGPAFKKSVQGRTNFLLRNSYMVQNEPENHQSAQTCAEQHGKNNFLQSCSKWPRDLPGFFLAFTDDEGVPRNVWSHHWTLTTVPVLSLIKTVSSCVVQIVCVITNQGSSNPNCLNFLKDAYKVYQGVPFTYRAVDQGKASRLFWKSRSRSKLPIQDWKSSRLLRENTNIRTCLTVACSLPLLMRISYACNEAQLRFELL